MRPEQGVAIGEFAANRPAHDRANRGHIQAVGRPACNQLDKLSAAVVGYYWDSPERHASFGFAPDSVVRWQPPPTRWRSGPGPCGARERQNTRQRGALGKTHRWDSSFSIGAKLNVCEHLPTAVTERGVAVRFWRHCRRAMGAPSGDVSRGGQRRKWHVVCLDQSNRHIA